MFDSIFEMKEGYLENNELERHRLYRVWYIFSMILLCLTGYGTFRYTGTGVITPTLIDKTKKDNSVEISVF